MGLTGPVGLTGSAASRPEGTRSATKGAGLASNDCPACGGAGFYVPDVSVGHPEFGKALHCHCRLAQRTNRRAQRLNAMSALFNLRDMTFDTFHTERQGLQVEKNDNLKQAYKLCFDYAIHPSGWLVLTGAYGCGKTHLAAAIAHARLEMGESALFMVAPDLLDHLRSTYGPDSEISYDDLFEEVRSTPLLVLDDLGSQSNTTWAQEKLFQLLNHRYSAKLPTVITTNQRIDDIEPRLRSRMLDVRLVNHFPIMAPDYRVDREPGQDSLSALGMYHNMRFDNFDPRREDFSAQEREDLKVIYNVCKAYAQQPSGWIVLAGIGGWGKTHLAAAIANHQTQQFHNEAMFIFVPDLLDLLRATFTPQSTTTYDRRFDEIKRVPLLVLDDLGIESATPWAKEKLFQLLNYRYVALLPTVITTSAKDYELDLWLHNRMRDSSRCKLLPFSSKGYGGGGAGQAAPSSQAGYTRRGGRTANR